MKQIKNIIDIVNLTLDVGERLSLFREDCCIGYPELGGKEDYPVPELYINDWSNLKSMWDCRWEDGHAKGHCKSLFWLTKPIELKKMIKSIDARNCEFHKKDSRLTPFKGISESLIEESLAYPISFELKRHSSKLGHYSHTTLDFYITRTESKEEFENRSKIQIEFINKVLKERHEKYIRTENEAKLKRQEEYKNLKKEFN